MAQVISIIEKMTEKPMAHSGEANNVEVASSRLNDLITLLSISRTFRNQFREHEGAMSRLWGLSPEDQAHLRKVGWDTIEKYAEKVLSQRAARIRGWLPGISALLGEDLLDRISAYCECFPPQRAVLPTVEALQFVDYLTFHAEYPIPGFPYANEVIDFERTRLDVLLSRRDPDSAGGSDLVAAALEDDSWEMLKPRVGPELMLKSYNYPIDQILKKLLAGEKVSPEPDGIWVVFIRRLRKQAVIARRIKESTKMLIEECTGERSIGAIIRGMRDDLRLTGPPLLYFENDCRQFLRKLGEEGLLELVE